MIPEEYESIILKSLNGTASREEEALLENWRNSSSENRMLLEDYTRLYRLKGPGPAANFDTRAEWARLENKINGKVVALPRRMVWARIAASFLLIALSIFIVREMVRERMIEHVSAGHAMSFKLHDGTSVILKEHSKLVHSTSFNASDRIVELTGTAFFEVSENKSKPFTIKAQESTVTVLGTKFMVHADPGQAHKTVHVVEGVVRLDLQTGEKATVTLTAGQKATADIATGSIDVKKMSADNVFAWRDRKLVFSKTSLDEVIDAVEQYFGIEITVTDASVLHCRFTGTFNDPKVEDIMEAISVSLDMEIILKEGKYTFAGTGCH
jgi:transmembrane sensor